MSHGADYFTNAASMGLALVGNTATRLGNGTVLVTGGQTPSTMSRGTQCGSDDSSSSVKQPLIDEPIGYAHAEAGAGIRNLAGEGKVIRYREQSGVRTNFLHCFLLIRFAVVENLCPDPAMTPLQHSQKVRHALTRISVPGDAFSVPKKDQKTIDEFRSIGGIDLEQLRETGTLDTMNKHNLIRLAVAAPVTGGALVILTMFVTGPRGAYGELRTRITVSCRCNQKPVGPAS